MFAALILSVLAAGPVTAGPPSNDPPIELWINNDRRFLPGENVQVQVRTQEDGYLVVLQADPDGRLRVLFPLDPDDDNLVRSGKRYEVHDRAGRDAFAASVTGQGTVYAAISRDPFDFQRYTAGGHWDYQALAPDRLPRDPEAALTELVRGMARSNFDYDVLSYNVIEQVYTPYYRPYRGWAFNGPCDPFYYDYYCGPYGSGSFFSVSLTFGRPYRPFYNPFFYSPFHYRPIFYRPVFISPYPYFYSPRRPYTGPLRVRGQLAFDNYRDRRNTFGRFDGGYQWPLVRTRDAVTATRRVDGGVSAAVGARANAPVGRPAIERRPVNARPAIERQPVNARPSAQPADRDVGRRVDRAPVEAHRARPRDTDSHARPNIESRPAQGRPEGRRVERSQRGGGDAPRAESSRQSDGGGDRGARGDDRGGDRRGGDDARPSRPEGRSGGWGDGGGGRRR